MLANTFSDYVIYSLYSIRCLKTARSFPFAAFPTFARQAFAYGPQFALNVVRK